MKPTHIEHIGIAVQSLDEAIPFYEKVLGLKCYAIEEVKDQKVKTAFFQIGKFVEKNGGGMHHIAFAVEDVATALNDAAEAGCQLIDKAPRAGAEGLQIGFLHPKSTNRVLTELCGKK